MRTHATISLLLCLLTMGAGCAGASGEGTVEDDRGLTGRSAIEEVALGWPSEATGSTHELAFRPGADAVWITGQNHDHLARVTPDGDVRFFAMPPGSGPHGILFDGQGRLWVSLEFAGKVVQVNDAGAIVREIDVRLHAEGAAAPINTSPHGLGLDPDGETLWFTGKKTNTVGRIQPDGTVAHFELPTVGAVPIYLAAGPDGAMWGTELVGNKIVRVTKDGAVTELAIDQYASRPIAVVPGPDGQTMWFSQEASHSVARIGMDGTIDTFVLPATQDNMLLAGLAFDADGHLWTQSYVDPHDPAPQGPDYILKVDRAVHAAPAGDLSGVTVERFEVPTRNTVMHRIVQGPDGRIWFTELAADRVGLLPSGG